MNATDNIKSASRKAVPVELPLSGAADMTPEAASNLLLNGTKEFERIFPPESAAEAVAQAVTTPTQRAEAVIEKFKANGIKFPEGTAGAVLCGVQDDEAEPEGSDDAPAIAPAVDAVLARRKAEGEGGYFYGIPPQPEIQVSTVADGSIEIAEISPLGSEDDARIVVNVSNAVRLARCILFAAGFQNILFAVGGPGGGYEDLHDGGEAWQFEQEREGAH